MLSDCNKGELRNPFFYKYELKFSYLKLTLPSLCLLTILHFTNKDSHSVVLYNTSTLSCPTELFILSVNLVLEAAQRWSLAFFFDAQLKKRS